MSTSTISPTTGGFDDFERHEFDLIVADFRPDPEPEPEPEPDETGTPQRRRRRNRLADERLAIAESLGFRRHRSREREV